jgi:hypothetical protein
VSTAVASTALASGPYVQRPDLPLPKRGVEWGLLTPPRVEVEVSRTRLTAHAHVRRHREARWPVAWRLT